MSFRCPLGLFRVTPERTWRESKRRLSELSKCAGIVIMYNLK